MARKHMNKMAPSPKNPASYAPQKPNCYAAIIYLLWLGFCGPLILDDRWQLLATQGCTAFNRESLPPLLKLMVYGFVTIALSSIFYFNCGAAVGDTHQQQNANNFFNL